MPNLHPKHATHKRPLHPREGSGQGGGPRHLKQLLLVLSIGIAAVATIAAGSTGLGADGIGDVFLALAGLAGLTSLTAFAVIPAAASFLPKLRLAPRVAIH